MNYQTATGLSCFEFTLGVVFARTPYEAGLIASKYTLWDKRADGSWGQDATTMHAQLCRDQQAAWKRRAG